MTRVRGLVQRKCHEEDVCLLSRVRNARQTRPGGAAGRARSNKLMQWRVGLQGAALVLFVLLLSLLNSTR